MKLLFFFKNKQWLRKVKLKERSLICSKTYLSSFNGRSCKTLRVILQMVFLSITGPSAFRLKAHPGAVYEPSLERGRPVLYGPLAANQLITEVGVIFNHVHVFNVGQGLHMLARCLYVWKDCRIYLSLGDLNFNGFMCYRFLGGHRQCPCMLGRFWSLFKHFLNAR